MLFESSGWAEPHPQGRALAYQTAREGPEFQRCPAVLKSPIRSWKEYRPAPFFARRARAARGVGYFFPSGGSRHDSGARRTNFVDRPSALGRRAPMLGALLAQLDAAGEVDLGGRAATPELVKPAIAASSPKPSTIERRARLVRAKQRQAAATAATGETAAPAGPWPVLRTEFHAAIKARHLSRSQIAASLTYPKAPFAAGWRRTVRRRARPISPRSAPGSTSRRRRRRRRRRPHSVVGHNCGSACATSSVNVR